MVKGGRDGWSEVKNEIFAVSKSIFQPLFTELKYLLHIVKLQLEENTVLFTTLSSFFKKIKGFVCNFFSNIISFLLMYCILVIELSTCQQFQPKIEIC